MDSSSRTLFGDATNPVLHQGPGLSLTTEVGRWHARDVEYLAGTWSQLARRIPRFHKEPFRLGPEEPPNPYLESVVREPLSPADRAIPVGVVSKSYSLVQHTTIIEACLAACRQHAIPTETLKCELGMTPLGEWINFRAYFPETYGYSERGGQKLGLRLECFNSVDGSSRLVILLGWLRLVCSNGLIIGETVATLRAVHDETLDLSPIPEIIGSGLRKVEADRRRLRSWESTAVTSDQLAEWADGALAARWGRRAACRVFNLCLSGQDVEIVNPFDAVPPSRKQVRLTGPVPGAATPAQTLYEASQALSWVASRRNNPEERMEWQSQIAGLLAALRKATGRSSGN